MHNAGRIGTVSQAVGVPQHMDRFLQNPLMKEHFIGWKALKLRRKTGNGNDRHPLPRVRLSEDKVLVSGIEIDSPPKTRSI